MEAMADSPPRSLYPYPRPRRALSERLLRARTDAMPTSNDGPWQQKLAALRAHVAAHGRLPPQSHPSGLGAWISTQRRMANAGRKCRSKMPPERAAALEAVPGWTWAVCRKRARA